MTTARAVTNSTGRPIGRIDASLEYDPGERGYQPVDVNKIKFKYKQATIAEVHGRHGNDLLKFYLTRPPRNFPEETPCLYGNRGMIQSVIVNGKNYIRQGYKIYERKV